MLNLMKPVKLKSRDTGFSTISKDQTDSIYQGDNFNNSMLQTQTLMPSIDQAISFKDETDDGTYTAQNFNHKRNSTPTPLIESKVIK